MAENHDPKEVVVNVVQERAENMLNKTMMDRLKALNGLLAILLYVMSIPVLTSAIWLLYMRYSDCENLIRLPKVQICISIGLIFIVVISNCVVFFRERFPVPGLLVVMVPLVFMFVVGLALVGGNKMESRTIPATPIWLKSNIQDEHNWNNIKSCLYDTKLCDDLVSRSLTTHKAYYFSLHKLSPLESGCCKPSESCGMKYVNATFWKRHKKGGEAVDKSLEPYNSDCEKWSNDEHKLCYNCQSCKEGYRKRLESKWWKLGIYLVIMALLLIFTHILSFIFTMLNIYER